MVVECLLYGWFMGLILTCSCWCLDARHECFLYALVIVVCRALVSWFLLYVLLVGALFAALCVYLSL